jgi:hypothetical protein
VAEARWLRAGCAIGIMLAGRRIVSSHHERHEDIPTSTCKKVLFNTSCHSYIGLPRLLANLPTRSSPRPSRSMALGATHCAAMSLVCRLWGRSPLWAWLLSRGCTPASTQPHSAPWHAAPPVPTQRQKHLKALDVLRHLCHGACDSRHTAAAASSIRRSLIASLVFSASFARPWLTSWTVTNSTGCQVWIPP